MKSLILIIALLPLFVFSQNKIEDNENYAKITLKNGRIIECVIQYETDENITYYSLLEGGVTTISRDFIKNIMGKKNLPYVAKKKTPKEIQREIDENIKQQYEVALQSKIPITAKETVSSKHSSVSESAGDYLEQAGNNYLLGVGLGIGGGVTALLSTTKPDNEYLVYVGAGMALTGFVCTIIGHTKLIKAGKALNKNKSLSLHPSTSGLGLALKF